MEDDAQHLARVKTEGLVSKMNMGKPDEGPVLTVAEVAQFLRLSRSKIYRMIHGKQLPAFRVGSDWRINSEQVREWLQRLQKSQADGSSDRVELSNSGPHRQALTRPQSDET